jgi:hypothetical protein
MDLLKTRTLARTIDIEIPPTMMGDSYPFGQGPGYQVTW